MSLINKIKSSYPQWIYFYLIFFGLAYSQNALFFSNQNTKFISGLALANYRDIASDWMANITDPFPLFSNLLKWQYEIFGLQFGVHFSFYLVTVALGFTGIWYAKNIIGDQKNKEIILLVFSLFWIIINTAVLRPLFLKFFPDGLAFQYIFKSYYQPSVFGIFLLIGIAIYSSGRPILATLFFILCPLFHPTYLIASYIIAITLICLPINKSLNISWKKRFVFFLITILTLSIYAIWITDLLSSGDPEIKKEAHILLSKTLIPFHSIPSEWSYRNTWVFFIVGFVASWLNRKEILGQLLFVLLIIVGFTVLWIMVDFNPTLSVIAPWRISVFIAPLSWIIILTELSKWVTQLTLSKAKLSARKIKIFWLVIVILTGLLGVAYFFNDYQKKKEKNYYAISMFLAKYHVHGYQYLVPLTQMNIRLEAGVPVYVTRKSYPNKDNELLNWYERKKVAERIFNNQNEDENILKLLKNEAITHIVWPSNKGVFPYAKYGGKVYEDIFYSLWEMK